jgi:hypothetical protein
MLQEAARLLPDLDLRPLQGSWSGSVGASAGTHSGAGAIDLDARRLTTDQRVQLATVMRQVGFAAWVRGPDGWAGGFDTWHVHGIAVGATGLSPAAADQVDDYRAGRDGLARNGPDYHTRAYARRTWEQYKAMQPEEEEMAVQAVTFFTHEGRIYEADLLTGTYWHIPNPQTLKDRRYVLESNGVRFGDHAPGQSVANPAAFGREVPGPS